MEENFHSLDVIFSGEVGSEQKEDEEEEKKCLAKNSEELNKPVFLRSFFFQLLISPGQFLQILFDWQFEGKADLWVGYRRKSRQLHRPTHN